MIFVIYKFCFYRNLQKVDNYCIIVEQLYTFYRSKSVQFIFVAFLVKNTEKNIKIYKNRTKINCTVKFDTNGYGFDLGFPAPQGFYC